MIMTLAQATETIVREHTDMEGRRAKEIAENHRKRPIILERKAFEHLLRWLSTQAIKLLAPEWEATLAWRHELAAHQCGAECAADRRARDTRARRRERRATERQEYRAEGEEAERAGVGAWGRVMGLAAAAAAAAERARAPDPEAAAEAEIGRAAWVADLTEAGAREQLAQAAETDAAEEAADEEEALRDRSSSVCPERPPTIPGCMLVCALPERHGLSCRHWLFEAAARRVPTPLSLVHPRWFLEAPVEASAGWRMSWAPEEYSGADDDDARAAAHERDAGDPHRRHGEHFMRSALLGLQEAHAQFSAHRREEVAASFARRTAAVKETWAGRTAREAADPPRLHAPLPTRK